MIAAQSRATARYALPRRNVATKKVSACREPTRRWQATGLPTSQGSTIHQAVYVAVMVYHQHQRSTVYDTIIVYQNYDAVMVNHQQQALYHI